MQIVLSLLFAHAGGLPPYSDNITSCRISDPGDSCLHVAVTGIRNKAGVIRMALYDSEKSYDLRQNPCRSAIPDVTDSKVDVIFNNLKPGWYAVLLYHDADNNNRFDSVIGIPMECFGFSNNIKPRLGSAPGFEDTRFRLEPSEYTTIEIHLQYLI